MAKTAILAIRILSDASRATKGFQQAESASERFGRRSAKAARVASVGLLALGAAAVKSGKAAAEDQRGQALLAQALRKSTNARGSDIKSTEAWIDKTARATGVADDELRPAMAALARATGSTAKSQAALSQALDISAATGKDVGAVSAAIAKGYAGNTTALGRLVPGLDKATLKSGDMNKIMAELARTTGGSAAKAADTTAGKMARMSVAMGEAQEQIGAALLPVMTYLATTLASVAAFVQQNSTLVTILAAVLGALAIGVIAVNAAYKVFTAYTRVAAAVQWAYNAALAANPIGLVIVAVLALVAGFVLAYKKSDRFRAIVQAVGKAASTAISWVVTKVTSLWNWLGKLGPIMNKGKEIAKTAFKVYTTPIRTVIDLVKKLIDYLGRIKFPKVPKAISKLGGALGGLLGSYTIPGGPGASVAMAPRVFAAPGELKAASPSLVALPVGGRGAGYGNTVINIYGVTDSEGAAREIRKLLKGSNIRNGRAAVGVA